MVVFMIPSYGNEESQARRTTDHKVEATSTSAFVQDARMHSLGEFHDRDTAKPCVRPR